ncbi:ComEA family DNA-binding protein [Streptomyces finlayi]|uniref:ComEA family DNA-binding protein n=1 Tax=Streptomyces finlayi TaxID=67296 RepID=UPI00215655D7|nr:ComEA family DNA-binding protein [Streptomyces finlayi]
MRHSTARHGRRRPARGRAAAVAAASRQRADELMAVAVADGAEPARSAPPVGEAGRARPGWRDRAVPAVRERLPLWLQLRCGLEPKTLASLGAVMVAAAILAGMHFWSARPQAVTAPGPVKDSAAATVTAAPAPAVQPSAGPSPTAAADGRIIVDVSGKVRRPGIQHLPPGSRVADALRAAGGVRDGTDVTALNRARVLTDGEQVVVGLPAGPWSVGGAPGAGTAEAAGPPAPVSLSTATVEQLETLPGVGPVLAQHIVDYRAEHGGYRSVDELREVNGIGDRRFEDLQPLVRP